MPPPGLKAEGDSENTADIIEEIFLRHEGSVIVLSRYIKARLWGNLRPENENWTEIKEVNVRVSWRRD